MSFEKRMGYKPYKFKFDEAIYLAVKSKEEVERINETLKEESPESDYESYSWYLTAEIADKLKSQKLKIDMQISWHIGLPFYRVQKIGIDERKYYIAEFYLQNFYSLDK